MNLHRQPHFIVIARALLEQKLAEMFFSSHSSALFGSFSYKFIERTITLYHKIIFINFRVAEMGRTSHKQAFQRAKSEREIKIHSSPAYHPCSMLNEANFREIQ